PASHNDGLTRFYFDDDDPDKRFNVKLQGVRVGDVDKQVDFYLQAEQSVKELFSSANILFSSQPHLHNNPITPWFRKAYRLGATPEEIEASRGRLKVELDSYMTRASQTKCGTAVGSETFGYFMARSALRLGQVATEWSAESKDRSVLYANVEMVFPGSY